MGHRSIPERWVKYIPIGRQIHGTRFVAFKVPLEKHVADTVPAEAQLTCSLLLQAIPNLGMVIDLTNTYRYYKSYEFAKHGVIYKKLMVPGHNIPPENMLHTFKRIVWKYLNENSNNSSLIGVHCTHGVNRTGYFICNFMVSELNFDVNDALQRFREARGHHIERRTYIDHLKTKVYRHQLRNIKYQRRNNYQRNNRRI